MRAFVLEPEPKKVREMEGRMEVEKSLHEAAVKGDVELLDQVLNRDPLILDRISVGSLVHTPLHVAAFKGHLEFVRRLLSESPDLAGVLDQRRWSALHLAAAKGHRPLVKELVQANPDMCTTLDADGRNPLHLATIKKNIDVLIELFEAQRHRIGELLSTRDANDDTVLHLAVKNLPPEMLKRFLYTKEAMEAKPTNNEQALNAIDKRGFTPLDILEQTDRSKHEIEYTLRAAGCLKAKEINPAEWLLQNRESLMVVASLFATMTFQAMLSPPGGYWQDTKGGHRAGENVMASNWPSLYSIFLLVNAMGFFGSITTIFFLVPGERYWKNNFHSWALVLSIFDTGVCTVVAFTISILATTAEKDRPPFTNVIVIYGWTCCAIMVVLFLRQQRQSSYLSSLTRSKTRDARKALDEMAVSDEIYTEVEVASRPS